MKRKVVKQGACTLMVSLPSDWTKRFRIRKGDELEVEERDRIITISTFKEHSDRETELNVDDLKPMILASAGAIYKAGYDTLKITFSDPKRMIDIDKIVREEFSGFEIVEQGKKHCVIKKIEESLEEGFEPVLRRTFLLVLNMADDSLEAVKKGDLPEIQKLKLLERVNNRLTTYCMRYLSKRGYKDPSHIHFIYYILEILEKVADECDFLFDHLIARYKSGFNLSKETIEYYEDANKMFRLYYELFYKYDKEKLVKIGEAYYDLLAKTPKLMQSKPKDAYVIHHLANIKEFTFTMVAPYLSMIW